MEPVTEVAVRTDTADTPLGAASRDIQCLAILQGLDALIAALSEPIARQAIDLDRQPGSRRYDVLLRLRDSLAQYADRSVDLFYVGLLGHFSSGKSSTINSLLDLWAQDGARQVGLHPTDRQVTLIAHPSKQGALLGIVQEGRRVIIRSQPVAHEFLEHIVLADTPGTGDPLLIKEMATDFLPVCDLLLFFLSATSPLDSTDKPLLTEKVNRLPFLPMRFIVTRADEFRLSHDAPLTQENLNEAQATTFVNELVARVNDVAGTPQYNASDFILVSNKSPYFNIAALRNELAEMAAPTNAAVQLRIHGHKIQYFARGAQDSRDFFVATIDAKLSGMIDLLAKASQNIEKYQNSVRISNNRLTETWLKHLSAMETLRQTATERIVAFPPVPADLGSLTAQDTFTPNTQTAIAAEVMTIASLLISAVDRLVHGRFTEHLRALDRRVTQITIADAQATPVDAGHFVAAVSASSVHSLNPRFLLELAPARQRGIANTIYGYKGALTQHLERQAGLLTTAFPIENYATIVQQAREGLAKDLEAYFNLVEVYRSGVFSSQARVLIEQLGIGRELGQIEMAFSDEHRAAIASDADRALFADAELRSSGFATKVAELKGMVAAALSDLRSVGLREASSPDAAIRQAFAPVSARVVAMLEGRVSAEVNRRLAELNVALAAATSEVGDRHAAEMAKATRARRRLYRRAGLLGLGVGVIALAAHFFMGSPAGTSIGATIGLGLVVEAITGGAGLAFGKFRDDFPKRTKEIDDRATVDVQKQWTAAIDAAGKDSEFIRSAETAIAADLAAAYKEILAAAADEEWERSCAAALDSIRNVERRQAAIVTAYRELAKEAFRISADYLRDADANLSKLDEISSGIRAQAIQPSFEFLNGAQRALQDLRSRLASISFV